MVWNLLTFCVRVEETLKQYAEIPYQKHPSITLRANVFGFRWSKAFSFRTSFTFSAREAHQILSSGMCNRCVCPGASFAPNPRSIISVCGSCSSRLASLFSKRSGERIAQIFTSSADGRSKRKSTFQCKVLSCFGNRSRGPKSHSINRFIIFFRIECGGLWLLRVACRISRRASEVAPFSESAEPIYT